MKNLVDDIANRLILAICEEPDFSDKVKGDKDNDRLLNMLYLLVEHEKYEQAVLVRDEIISRKLDITSESKYITAEKKVNEFLNKLL
jgi:KaiC/GvpD/RAD55 family RecA-like ATPase